MPIEFWNLTKDTHLTKMVTIKTDCNKWRKMNQTSNTYLRNMYSKYEYFDLQPHDGVFFMQLRFEQEKCQNYSEES